VQVKELLYYINSSILGGWVGDINFLRNAYFPSHQQGKSSVPAPLLLLKSLSTTVESTPCVTSSSDFGQVYESQ